MEIKISNVGLKWIAEINSPYFDLYTGAKNFKMEIVSEFEYYRDIYNQIWINNISTNGKYQNKGIGTLMIKKALEEYGIIWNNLYF